MRMRSKVADGDRRKVASAGKDEDVEENDADDEDRHNSVLGDGGGQEVTRNNQGAEGRSRRENESTGRSLRRC